MQFFLTVILLTLSLSFSNGLAYKGEFPLGSTIKSKQFPILSTYKLNPNVKMMIMKKRNDQQFQRRSISLNTREAASITSSVASSASEGVEQVVKHLHGNHDKGGGSFIKQKAGTLVAAGAATVSGFGLGFGTKAGLENVSHPSSSSTAKKTLQFHNHNHRNHY